MSDYLACHIIGALFLLIAAQYKECNTAAFIFTMVGIVWFVNALFQQIVGTL